MSDKQPLPEDAAIEAAHPLRTGDHATYAEAMRLVGARSAKGDLVDLVNWLLRQRRIDSEKGLLLRLLPADITLINELLDLAQMRVGARFSFDILRRKLNAAKNSSGGSP